MASALGDSIVMVGGWLAPPWAFACGIEQGSSFAVELCRVQWRLCVLGIGARGEGPTG